MSQHTSKPAGIREIAAALGVSIGTVDRALHARSGVSASTRDRVREMAAKLNYSPNTAARSLRLNRRSRIGVFLPRQIALFFDPLRDGVRQAAESFTPGAVEVVFHTYPRIGEGEMEALTAANWEQFDGVILAPGSPGLLPMLQRAHQRKIPVVFVASDFPRLPRLASIAVDAMVSGGIAAELLGHKLAAPSTVAAFTGDLAIQDHADKLRGFAATLATLAPHLSLLPAVESHDRPAQAYKAALDLFRRQPKIGGIYVSTANGLPVLKAARELNLLGKVQIVCTDLSSGLLPMIERGFVFAALHQRPLTQGRMALDLLARFLTAGTTPQEINRLAPHIVLRSNLSLFSGNISLDAGASG
ncbi:LacI family DNA-binding transcriptional regulator [Granulicella rosea]|uniref:LacI family DNA-binding transcriptional regulator n=1 Tax=Granulicella rosea TaxID=474952 RepID=UPI001FE623C1|nr:LacI family DNA-binding transcriptional regulator [Granulicella rosea]